MKSRVLATIALFAFFQCKNAAPKISNMTAGNEDIVGLASAIQLAGVKTTVLLEDYFLDVSKIDSVRPPLSLSALLSPDKKELQLTIEGDLPFYENLSIFAGALRYDFLIKAPQKIPVKLDLADKNYRSVQVKGEMNNWNPADGQMQKDGENWSVEFELMPGNYQYLFIADGKEMLDPANSSTAPNGMGGTNSLLSLRGAEGGNPPLIFSKKAEKDKVTIGLENQPAALKVYWQNHLIEARKVAEDFEIALPEIAKTVKRSFLRIYGQNEFGVSNDILIPLEFGAPLSSPEQLSRADNEAQIMYFVLVDRFFNGNPQNDRPVKDARVLPIANYQGGDIAGITQKIKEGYFKSLNINSIWLSPITQNPDSAFQEYPEPRRWYTGYHGYWPVLSYKLDDRFGSDAEMKELVKTAHENGINLLLDYVCNHVHQDHPMIKNHSDWATQLDLPDGRKNLRIWDEYRLTTWFDTFLPTLDLENPEVAGVQSDSAMYWVKVYGLDGYRQDATKHIPVDFWRLLTRKLKTQVMAPESRSLYQIGETYGSRELIQSYMGSGTMEAQFDFPLYFDAREVFGKDETSFKFLSTSLNETFRYFGHHSAMGYITGNHDQSRFVSLAGGGLKWDEDAREAGFARTVGVGADAGYDKLQMLTAFVLAIPGVPVIFYGDEIGIPGAGDPDNRKMMRFEGWSEREADTKSVAEKLTSLRSRRLSLIYGDTRELLVEDQTYAFGRFYFGEATVAVFNKSGEEKTLQIILPDRFADLNFKTNFKGKMAQEKNKISLTLPPLSFEILTD